MLGLVAGCMGVLRGNVDRLLAIADGTRVHIRVDAAGTPLVDDQTIQDNPSASSTRQTIQSKRTYLCDASFVAVIVPGANLSVGEMAQAVRFPVFPPFLGRRTCVPSTPLLIAKEVSGADPVALFDTIEEGPTELFDQLRANGRATPSEDQHGPQVREFYLDVEHYPGMLRRIPIRDDFAGPLVRQWRERYAVHVRISDTTG